MLHDKSNRNSANCNKNGSCLEESQGNDVRSNNNITFQQLSAVFEHSDISLDTISVDFDTIYVILEQLPDDKLDLIQKKIQLAVQEMTDAELSATTGGKTDLVEVLEKATTGAASVFGTVYAAKELAQTVVAGAGLALAGGVMIYGIIDSIKQKRKNRK